MDRLLAWGVPAIALLMLALTITPTNVWNQPVNDTTYRGFDPNLIYASSGSGVVGVSPGSIDITAKPGPDPTINLVTTSLKRLDASVDVTVQENAGATMPFGIGMWSPLAGAAYFVVFESAPQNLITAQTIANPGSGFTLVSGTVLNRAILGTYKLGDTYRVAFQLDRAHGSITSRISNPDGTALVGSVDSQQSPKLFGDVALSLSASSQAGPGSSHVVLRNYMVNLPHERLWASKIADQKAQIALIALAIAGIVLIAIAFVRRATSRNGSIAGRGRGGFGGLRRGLAGSPRVTALCAVAIAVYLVGNALLFRFGGHPFDMTVEKLYAYVARTYGPSDLYYLPNTVTLSKIWQGTPIQEMAFPYEPVLAYLSTGIGWLNSVLFAGGATFSVFSIQLEYLIKMVNVLFGLGDGVLIYAILRQIGVSNRWSLVAGGLWLFNPAVWFSQSVWGQTHVISLFFVLAAVLLAEKRLSLWAWLALTAACLTRPQMLVFGLLLGVVFLRKFTWRQNALALSWTVILTFLALVPLTLAISPSLPVDVLVNTFHAHEASPTTSVVPLNFVSQDAYSVWPLVEYLTQGNSGLHHAFNPSGAMVVGSLTYQQLSQILTLAAIVLVAAFLYFRKRATTEPGAYIPHVALGFTSFLMLLFALIATHFLLAIPFLLLARRWMDGLAYFYVAVTWTVTTLVTMYGDMGQTLLSRDYPLLAPANNAVTSFVVSLYTNDRFITVGIVANICAVIWLGYLTLRPPKAQVTV